jgi:hypothetical protein
MTISSLQKRVSKFTPKKFYMIDYRLKMFASDKQSSLLRRRLIGDEKKVFFPTPETV